MHIAVVGGGIAGCAAALAARRAGATVDVFETVPDPRALGAGLLLQPTGQAALAALGLLDAVARTAATVTHLQGETVPARRRVMDLRYADLAPELHGLGVSRGQLYSVLLEAALSAGARMHSAHEVVDASTSTDHARLTTADGVVRRFDAIVVAAGSGTHLATEGLARDAHPYAWGALWAVLPDAQDQHAGRLAQRYVGTAVMAGVLPMGADAHGVRQVSFFWSLHTAEHAAWRAAPLDAWRARVLSVWPELAPLLAPLRGHADLAYARYHDVRMRRSALGRVLWIGDAAHGMSPQLGQGANLALQDAVVLGAALATLRDPAAAFAAVDRARRAHLSFYRTASRWLTPFFQHQDGWLAVLRDLGMPIAHRVPWLQSEMLRTLAGVKTGWLSAETPEALLRLRE